MGLSDEYVPLRRLSQWNNPKATKVNYRPELKTDAVLLRRLVESETWAALCTVIDDSVSKHMHPLSLEPKDLISSIMSGIVRDVKDEIFKGILARAATADEREVAQVE